MKKAAAGKAQLIDRWATRRQRAIAFLREKGLRGLVKEVRSVGLGGSAAFIVRQLRYHLCAVLGAGWDKVHNVETSGQIDLINLEVVGGNRESGHAVVSTSPAMYRFLAQFFPGDWSNFTFVDVGSGKGRVVLLAMMQGFRSIVGIEFAPVICKVAEDNVARFRPRQAGARCSIINADATEADLPLDAPLLIYCANPFNAEVWKKFVPRLVKTYDASRKRMCIVLSGSVPQAVGAAGSLIAERGRFRLRAHGVSPFFVDSYLPYEYWVFDACGPDA